MEALGLAGARNIVKDGPWPWRRGREMFSETSAPVRPRPRPSLNCGPCGPRKNWDWVPPFEKKNAAFPWAPPPLIDRRVVPLCLRVGFSPISPIRAGFRPGRSFFFFRSHCGRSMGLPHSRPPAPRNEWLGKFLPAVREFLPGSLFPGRSWDGRFHPPTVF